MSSSAFAQGFGLLDRSRDSEDAFGEDDFVEVGGDARPPAIAALSSHAQDNFDPFGTATVPPSFDPFSAASPSFLPSSTPPPISSPPPASSRPSRPRAASHAYANSMQLSSDVASSLAQLSMQHNRAKAGSILAQRTPTRLSPLTQPQKHMFVLVKKGCASASLVSLHLAQQSGAAAALHVEPFVPPVSPAAASAGALAGAVPLASASSAALAVSRGGALASSKGAAGLGFGDASAAARSGSLAAPGAAAGLASLLLNPSVLAAGNGTSSAMASPVSPVSSLSSDGRSDVKPVGPIALSAIQSVNRGYASKKFASLAPPAELEAAAFSVVYLSETKEKDKEAKKKHLHLLALSSKGKAAWTAALDAANEGSIEAAQRAADTSAFDLAAQSDVHYSSLLIKHFPHLATSLHAAAASTLAPASAEQAASADAPIAAPAVPSRRKSQFHGEYVATKGFTQAPSVGGHGRSSTVFASSAPFGVGGTAQDVFATASSLPPISDALSPHTVRTIDVLPLLQRGCYFLKFPRSGGPRFRFYKLSEDCLTLCPFEKRKDVSRKIPSKAIDLRSIDRVHLGQASPRFKGVPASLSSVSFTISLRSDALVQGDDSKHVGPSLMAPNIRSYHVWTRGLVHLLRMLAEYDRAQDPSAASRTSNGTHSRSNSAASPPWPPPSLLLDIPAPVEPDQPEADARFVELDAVRGVEGAAWRKVQREMMDAGAAVDY